MNHKTLYKKAHSAARKIINTEGYEYCYLSRVLGVMFPGSTPIGLSQSESQVIRLTIVDVLVGNIKPHNTYHWIDPGHQDRFVAGLDHYRQTHQPKLAVRCKYRYYQTFDEQVCGTIIAEQHRWDGRWFTIQPDDPRRLTKCIHSSAVTEYYTTPPNG